MYAWSYAGVIVGSIELWCKVYVGAPSGAIDQRQLLFRSGDLIVADHAMNAYASLIPIAAEAAPT